MAEQTYETHRHNPKLTGIGFLFLSVAAVAFGLRWLDIGGRVAFAAGLAALMASQLVMLIISRYYTTRLQDRIIKLEMKLRCAQLLSPAGHAAAGRLSNAQIIALRFASDQELPALLERADREHLTAEQIKKAVKNWVPDLDRT
jgi:predicted phage-related endonuclease